MFKMPWKTWLLVVVLLAGTNAVSWNRQRITKLFELEKPVGQVNIGVLIDDKMLSGNKVEDIAFAQTYLSENYHYLYLPDKYEGKIPLPWSPFTESTGFHFQVISKKQPPPQFITQR